MAEMFILMWLGRRAAARGICLSFQIGQILRTFTISPTINTIGRHLGFERDYNYHAALRACYVIMHKVYSVPIGKKVMLRKVLPFSRKF